MALTDHFMKCQNNDLAPNDYMLTSYCMSQLQVQTRSEKLASKFRRLYTKVFKFTSEVSLMHSFEWMLSMSMSDSILSIAHLDNYVKEISRTMPLGSVASFHGISNNCVWDD